MNDGVEKGKRAQETEDKRRWRSDMKTTGKKGENTRWGTMRKAPSFRMQRSRRWTVGGGAEVQGLETVTQPRK